MIKNIYANEVYEAEINGIKYRLSIHQDDYAESPRSWDNLSTMWIWWHNYCLGDKKDKGEIESLNYLLEKYLKKTTEDFNNILEIFEALKSIEDLAFKAIYVCEHSGLTLGYSDFGDKWDSGIAGFAFIEKETIMNELCLKDEADWKEYANKSLDNEMQVYQDYVEGNVFWYSLESLVHKKDLCPHCGEILREYDEWEEESSCSGFYGNNIEENGMSEDLPEEFIKNAKQVK